MYAVLPMPLYGNYERRVDPDDTRAGSDPGARLSVRRHYRSKRTAQDIAAWRAVRRKARLEAVHRVRSFEAIPHGEWHTATAEDILADLHAGIDAIRNQPRPSQREIDERIATNAKLRQLYDEASPEEKIRMQETALEIAALRIMHQGGP